MKFNKLFWVGLILFTTLIMLNLVSAAWTEKAEYSNDDLTVTMKSWWGFFEWLGINQTIGTFTLASHKSIEEIKQVGIGKQVVMFYDFNFKEIYENGLGDVSFTNIRTGKLIERDWKYVYFTNETLQRGVCLETGLIFDAKNGTEIESCIKYGTEDYVVGVWRDYNLKTIPINNIRIGIEVDNKNNDYIDGVWNIGGKEITKHAGWNASLDNGLVSYYKLDETSGVVIDSLGLRNGTNGGAIANSTGKINTAYKFDGINDNVTMTGNLGISGAGARTLNAWINVTDATGDARGFLGWGGTGANTFFVVTNSVGGSGNWSVWTGSGTTEITSNASCSADLNTYVMITSVYNGTATILYRNGVIRGIKAGTIATTDNVLLLGRATQDTWGAGIIDEVSIWNRTLSADEIIYLYNNGTGMSYGGYVLLNTLLFPINYYNSSSQDINFTANVIDDGDLGIKNVTLVIDGDDTYNVTNTSGVEGNYTFSETGFADGDYTWKVVAYDNSSVAYESETRIFTVDIIYPTITLNYPTALIDYGKLNTSLQLNFTATDTNLDKVWYEYERNESLLNKTPIFQIGDYWNFTANATSGTSGDFYIDYFIPYGEFGINNWGGGNIYGSWTSATTNKFCNFNFNSPNIYFSNDSEKYVCFKDYKGEYYLGKINSDRTINWSKITKNIIVGAVTGVYNISNITLSTKKNITIYANDTVGNLNETLFSWDYKLFQTNEYYKTPTISGAINPFNITFDSSSQITIAYLYYNNTNHLSSISSNGTTYVLSRNQIVPGVSTATNISFYWNITRADGFNYATTAQNQLVNPIVINSTCTGMYVIYNLTLADELTQAKLNGTAFNSSIKVDMDLYTSDRVEYLKNYYNEFIQTNPSAICIDNNLSLGETYSLDLQIQYKAINYSTELYHIRNYVLNSTSLNQNITLYDLPTENAQKFKLLVRDTSYLPIEGALVKIERKYIENGTFRITEIPKTDAKGTTSASLELNDVIYNFYIYENGDLISSFTNVLAICQTPLVSVCEIDFNAFQTGITIPDYEEGEDFNFTIGYNSTSRIVTSQFVIPSGEPSTVLLVVTREDTLGTAVCTDTLTSASGTLSCLVPTSFGNSTIIAKLYKDGVEQGKGNIKLDQNSSDIFGVILVVLSVFVLMTLIGIGISDNPIITAVFLFVGVILLYAMNLIQNTGFIGATASILFLGIAIILIIIKAARRT